MSNQKSNKLITILLCLFTISLITTSVFITGCGDEGDSPTEMVSETNGQTDKDNGEVVVTPDPVDPPDPVEPSVSFRNDILPIFAESCALANCHTGLSPARGLDLTDYNSFKEGGDSGMPFVDGNSAGSLVVTRIDGGGMPPPGNTPLTAEQIQLFKDWIDDGAKNN